MCTDRARLLFCSNVIQRMCTSCLLIQLYKHDCLTGSLPSLYSTVVYHVGVVEFSNTGVYVCMTSTVSIFPLGCTALCTMAFRSWTSHDLNKEGHIRKKFTMASCHNTQKHMFPIQQDLMTRGGSGCPCCHWPLSPTSMSKTLYFSIKVFHIFQEILDHKLDLGFLSQLNVKGFPLHHTIFFLFIVFTEYPYTQVTGSGLSEIHLRWKFKLCEKPIEKSSLLRSDKARR